jgi:hypothetical protein
MLTVVRLLIGVGLSIVVWGVSASSECYPVEFLSVGDTAVYAQQSSSTVLTFRSGMSIDADGAPTAYHPDNMGIDDLQHAGRPGSWHALVTDNNHRSGQPLIQSDNDPAPGYYVSTTSLFDRSKALSDPRRYVNALDIPYIVLPTRLHPGVSLGDLSVVINGRNDRMAFAIYADNGLANRIGEGSVALARQLGVPDSPRTGGVKDDVLYIVFGGSGKNKPLTRTEIQALGRQVYDQWRYDERMC